MKGSLRFLPQDFHTCGKAIDPELCDAENEVSGRYSWGESRQASVFRRRIAG
jgi:hypothetical protein